MVESNWSRGEPCPNCGNETFAFTELQTEEVVFDAEGDVAEVGDMYGAEPRYIECSACWELLWEHQDASRD